MRGWPRGCGTAAGQVFDGDVFEGLGGFGGAGEGVTPGDLDRGGPEDACDGGQVRDDMERYAGKHQKEPGHQTRDTASPVDYVRSPDWWETRNHDGSERWGGPGRPAGAAVGCGFVVVSKTQPGQPLPQPDGKTSGQRHARVPDPRNFGLVVDRDVDRLYGSFTLDAHAVVVRAH